MINHLNNIKVLLCRIGFSNSQFVGSRPRSHKLLRYSQLQLLRSYSTAEISNVQSSNYDSIGVWCRVHGIKGTLANEVEDLLIDLGATSVTTTPLQVSSSSAQTQPQVPSTPNSSQEVRSSPTGSVPPALDMNAESSSHVEHQSVETEHGASAWAECDLLVSFPDKALYQSAVSDLRDILGDDVADRVSGALEGYSGWRDQVQQEFGTMEIVPGLWMVPVDSNGQDVDQTAGGTVSAKEIPKEDIQIRLQPGLAFGTGDHPTTQIMCEWLQRQSLGGVRVLDLGTGSGVLSILALKLGALSAVGTEIDPWAISACKGNVTSNNYQHTFTMVPVYETDDLSSDIFAKKVLANGAKFDVAVANILLNVVCDHAAVLSSTVKSGGHVAFTGLLDTQVEQVIAAYGDQFEQWQTTQCAKPNTHVTGPGNKWVLLSAVRK